MAVEIVKLILSKFMKCKDILCKKNYVLDFRMTIYITLENGTKIYFICPTRKVQTPDGKVRIVHCCPTFKEYQGKLYRVTFGKKDKFENP